MPIILVVLVIWLLGWTWRLLRVSYLDSTSARSLVFRVTIAGSEKSDRRLTIKVQGRTEKMKSQSNDLPSAS